MHLASKTGSLSPSSAEVATAVACDAAADVDDVARA